MNSLETHVFQTSTLESATAKPGFSAEKQAPGPPSHPPLNKTRVNLDTWHRRMMHLSIQGVKETAKIANGINIAGMPASKRPCECCAVGKATNKPRCGPVLYRSNRTGELVYIDIGGGGKMRPALGTGAVYWLLMIDDFDGWADIRFLRTKGDAQEAIKNLLTSYEKDHQARIKHFVSLDPNHSTNEISAIQTDNGGEFIKDELQIWAKNRDITWHFIAPYAHEQNGKVERLMRIVGERMRAVLDDSNLPLFLWAEIMETVIYVRNRTVYYGRRYTRSSNKTPYELRYGRQPNLSYLRIIGCRVFKIFAKEQIAQSDAGKHLARRIEIGYLTGYADDSGAQYKVYRPYPTRQDGTKPNGGTIHVIRDAIFDEGDDWTLYNNPDLPPTESTLN
jgi:transposase InsO family protein